MIKNSPKPSLNLYESYNCITLIKQKYNGYYTKKSDKNT